MLAAGAAEAVERIAGDVIAALHGDLLDRLGHVGDRDLEETVGDFLGAAPVADARGEIDELRAHGPRHPVARRGWGRRCAGKIPA